MNRTASLIVPALLTFLLTACPQATPPVVPEPPVTPDPVTFPVTEISGTIPNWTAGEAFIALTSGYGATSTPEGVEDVTLYPPIYQTTLSAEGAFTVSLGMPAASERTTLTCGGQAYSLGSVGSAIVSTTPRPTQLGEFVAAYTLGPLDNQARNAAWLYSENALELDTVCAVLGRSVSVKLTLEPGWNQVVATDGTLPRIESGVVPTSFVWSEF